MSVCEIVNVSLSRYKNKGLVWCVCMCDVCMYVCIYVYMCGMYVRGVCVCNQSTSGQGQDHCGYQSLSSSTGLMKPRGPSVAGESTEDCHS
ncbi:rCG45901 [Rattus norvegicus]|uniref:RCG45901 n=1 Tax=Rattus norvegicus TaxID=10116 RepID=A6JU07_RAT|nr:rCG45901 [Rattus norvegicus]